MADSVQMRAPAHYLRVDLRDAAEAEYWLVVFDCERARLEAALAAVGCDALDVRCWLRIRAEPATGLRGAPTGRPTDLPPR